MFHANKGYKLEIVVLIPTSPFAKQAFSGDTLFKRYFHEDKALHTQMNHFNTVFQMKWDKWQRFQTLRSSFSDESTFNSFFFSGEGGGGGTFFSPVQGPDLDPVFRTIPSGGTVGMRSALLVLWISLDSLVVSFLILVPILSAPEI